MYNSNVVKSWRRIRKGNFIIGSRCRKCSALFLPPTGRCRKCGSYDTEDYKFSGKGRILSSSIVYSPMEGFEKQVPYTVAIVELDEGPRITSQVVDAEKVETGMEVEACIRKIFVDGKDGIIDYGIKFRMVQ